MMIRLYTSQPLKPGAQVTLDEKEAHYLLKVMRADIGQPVRLFNGRDGEWNAVLSEKRKRDAVLELKGQNKPQLDAPNLIACFAPPRGGRIDSIVEKATELGASVLQPVRCARSVVDSVNIEKWISTSREAAEQSERMDLPEIRPMVNLVNLLGNWPKDVPLLFGDESGASSVLEIGPKPASWGILIGPEGGFTEEERGLIGRISTAKGVALGPRILRVDTALITLCALTMHAWGDWNHKPRFEG